MKCPRCSAALIIGERKGVEIDYCNQCRGIWLDAGELDKIIDRSEQFASTTHEGRRGRDREPEQESWWERIIDIFD